jgi:hypothetical protein
MKQLTFLETDSTPAKGPYTFTRLRELWDAKQINADTKLFLTVRDDANKVECIILRASDIKENLEGGNEIDVASLRARIVARGGK